MKTTEGTKRQTEKNVACTVGPNSSTQACFWTDKHVLYSGLFYRMRIEWNTKGT